jgi:hypothetical protein
MREPAPPPPRLLADAMLVGLARWLRALGLDAACDPGLDDAALVDRALAEERVILTRDRRLVERKRARNHLFIRSEVVDEQVAQVLAELAIRPEAGLLFSRCLLCNAPLEDLPAAEAAREVPPYVARTQERFRSCPACRRIYWRATHAGRMRRRLRRMGIEIR